jgi:hypothetical protein
MSLLRRLLGATAQLLAAVGAVGCVAGVVGIWIFRHNMSGKVNKEAGKKEVVAASVEVDLVLQKVQATADEWQSDLDAAREELPRVKAEVLGWLTHAAVAVTVLCVWVAVSQMSLFAHARKWGRGA